MERTWEEYCLKIAGVYNILFGIWAIIFPTAIFEWCAMPIPNYPELWQCIGMIVGVYGVGYWIAGDNMYRYFPIILVGFLGKLLGPIGFLNGVWLGRFPWSFGIINVFNDLIWLIPFAIMLYKINIRHQQARSNQVYFHDPSKP